MLNKQTQTNSNNRNIKLNHIRVFELFKWLNLCIYERCYVQNRFLDIFSQTNLLLYIAQIHCLHELLHGIGKIMQSKNKSCEIYVRSHTFYTDDNNVHLPIGS